MPWWVQLTSTTNGKVCGLPRLNFPMLGNGDYLTVLNAGQSNQQKPLNSISENAMISYLGRANYIYDDKYYLTATFRRRYFLAWPRKTVGAIFHSSGCLENFKGELLRCALD